MPSAGTWWVLHVDMDQFIAAVEVLRRPELRGRPVVVGGDGDPSRRGVVSTASYEARQAGVHSGLPLRTAAKRCPDAVFLPVDKEAYDAASAQVMSALRSLPDVVVEVLGWDEAFLGVGTEDPESVARQAQEAVLAATGLRCTVDIGRNRLQAKLASGFGKPAGIFRLTGASWFDVLGDRPTDALWGIGTKTAQRLAALGIGTVRELADTDPDRLATVFGPATGPWLVRLAQGRDSGRVDPSPYVARSRSREVTFQTDLTDWAEVVAQVAGIADRVADDVLAEGRPVTRVVVKVRYRPFVTQTHGVGVGLQPGDREGLRAAAAEALARFEERRPVRLLGVRAEFAD